MKRSVPALCATAAAMALFASIVGGPVAYGAAAVWIGPDGDWHDANNWNTPNEPNATDNVVISPFYAPTTVTVAPGLVGEANDLTVSGKGVLVVAPSAQLEVNGKFTVVSGFDLQDNGQAWMNQPGYGWIDGPGEARLAGGSINAASGALDHSVLRMGGYGSIGDWVAPVRLTNASASTIEADDPFGPLEVCLDDGSSNEGDMGSAGGGVLRVNGCGTYPTPIDNAGALSSRGAGSTTEVWSCDINSVGGYIGAHDGAELWLGDGGLTGGVLEANDGTVFLQLLDSSDVEYRIIAGGHLNGAMPNITGGSLHVDGSGSAEFSHAIFDGVDVDSDSGARIDFRGDTGLSDCDVDNLGTFTFIDGTSTVTGGRFTNAPGAVVQMCGPGSFADGPFDNAGAATCVGRDAAGNPTAWDITIQFTNARFDNTAGSLVIGPDSPVDPIWAPVVTFDPDSEVTNVDGQIRVHDESHLVLQGVVDNLNGLIAGAPNASVTLDGATVTGGTIRGGTLLLSGAGNVMHGVDASELDGIGGCGPGPDHDVVAGLSVIDGCTPKESYATVTIVVDSNMPRPPSAVLTNPDSVGRVETNPGGHADAQRHIWAWNSPVPLSTGDLTDWAVTSLDAIGPNTTGLTLSEDLSAREIISLHGVDLHVDGSGHKITMNNSAYEIRVIPANAGIVIDAEVGAPGLGGTAPRLVVGLPEPGACYALEPALDTVASSDNIDSSVTFKQGVEVEDLTVQVPTLFEGNVKVHNAAILDACTTFTGGLFNGTNAVIHVGSDPPVGPTSPEVVVQYTNTEVDLSGAVVRIGSGDTNDGDLAPLLILCRGDFTLNGTLILKGQDGGHGFDTDGSASYTDTEVAGPPTATMRAKGTTFEDGSITGVKVVFSGPGNVLDGTDASDLGSLEGIGGPDDGVTLKGATVLDAAAISALKPITVTLVVPDAPGDPPPAVIISPDSVDHVQVSPGGHDDAQRPIAAWDSPEPLTLGPIRMVGLTSLLPGAPNFTSVTLGEDISVGEIVSLHGVGLYVDGAGHTLTGGGPHTELRILPANAPVVIGAEVAAALGGVAPSIVIGTPNPGGCYALTAGLDLLPCPSSPDANVAFELPVEANRIEIEAPVVFRQYVDANEIRVKEPAEFQADVDVGALWLEADVGIGETLRPRRKMTSVGQAYRAVETDPGAVIRLPFGCLWLTLGPTGYGDVIAEDGTWIGEQVAGGGEGDEGIKPPSSGALATMLPGSSLEFEGSVVIQLELVGPGFDPTGHVFPLIGSIDPGSFTAPGGVVFDTSLVPATWDFSAAELTLLGNELSVIGITPEPATLSVLGLGAAALLCRRRRRR